MKSTLKCWLVVTVSLLIGNHLRLDAAESSVALTNIVFGSCLNKVEHPMLDRTLEVPMDLFIFMGDNIYGDTTNMTVMRAKYDALKNSRFFQGLKKKAPFVATWDDHDYGVNDGGANFAFKKESQEEFYNWLDEPQDSPRRKQEGVYSSHIYGPEGKRVQVILLDTRYFRSQLTRGNHGMEPSGGPYMPSPFKSTTMLGDTQWVWLAEELKKPAEVRLMISSIQFVPEFCGCEAWANLPHEKERMLALIQETKANGIVFLSGDRHWCELSRMDGPTGYPLYELTASAMTQVHPRGTPTPNVNRLIPKTYHEANVGQLSIDWGKKDTELHLKIIDVRGEVQIEKKIKVSELQGK
ncbi:MAG TPA: alkaline phosphatase D family protein [Verrucomicrobiae bacterium]